MYLIRLDDASDKMDVDKWNRVEKNLDEYHIKPILGLSALMKMTARDAVSVM